MSELSAIKQTRLIASEIARVHAPDVDRQARFPTEAMSALRETGLLSVLVPTDLGGLGYSPATAVRMSTILGQACASTGMIFAMHQIQVLCLMRHGREFPFFRDFLSAVASERLLIASGTSEVGTYGDIRASIAAVETQGNRCRLRKECATISYGSNADAILVTARRHEQSPAGDQVLVLLPKAEYRLEQIGVWDTLGMRGTCSPPFMLEAEFNATRILPLPFREIAAQTLVPYAHTIWAAVWLGIAVDAVSICKKLFQADARRTATKHPAASVELAKAVAKLHDLKSLVSAASAEYASVEDTPQADRPSVTSAVFANSVKIQASELSCEICLACLSACGLRSYTDASPTGLGRHIRDVLSAPIMISNNRLAAINSALLQIDTDDNL